MSILVSTSDQLYEALGNAKGGETIFVEGGSYGSLTLNLKSYLDITFPSNVTITSVDHTNPAVFNGLGLHGVANLTIDNVVFDYTFAEGDSTRTRPFQVNGSQDIQITNSVFNGDLLLEGQSDGNGYGTAIGLSVRGSSNVVIEGNEFFDWHRGLVVDSVQNAEVRGNDVHDIRSDGMDFVNVQTITIEGNYIHDFKADYSSGDHRDMIQFWTTGSSTPSTDITIRNNTLDIGEGSYTQSIFMRNEVVDSYGGGNEMFYKNILIENNVITNGHLHGITVGETDGLTIRNNSVLAVADDQNPNQNSSSLWVPSIRVKPDSRNVVIEFNATSAIDGFESQPDWMVKMNAFIQNISPFDPGYYEDVFISSTMSGSGVHEFKAAPGGMLDNLGAGATSTISLSDSNVLYQVSALEGNKDAKVFDATLTQRTLINAGLGDADYVWTFGDGTVATGLVVEHHFARGGNYHVGLEVKLSNGTTYAANSVVDIWGSKVVSLDNASGTFTAYGFGEEHSLSELQNIEGGAIQLGGPGVAAQIEQNALHALHGANAMSLDFSLSGNSSGEIFRLHGTFIAWVDGEGEIVFQSYSEDGTKSKVTTSGARVNDGETHSISVDLAGGQLSVSVDSKATVSSDFFGTLPTDGSWDLTFGNPWGKPNFNGRLSAFDISVGNSSTVSDASLVDGTSSTDTATQNQFLSPNPTLVEQEALVEDITTIDTLIGVTSEENTFLIDFGSSNSGILQTSEESTLPLLSSIVSSQNVEKEAITFNGSGDYLDLGRLSQFEPYQRVGFSIDFNTNSGLDDDARLVWNHLKLGLTVQDEMIMVQAATANEGFKAFSASTENLGDGRTHNATVLLDTASDRLQVIVDDIVLLDVLDTDFELAGAGGREWGWSLGTPWNRFFEGNVSSFGVTDTFEFHDSQSLMTNDLLFA